MERKEFLAWSSQVDRLSETQKLTLTPHRYQKSHSILVRISQFCCALTGILEFSPVERIDKRQFTQFGVL